MTVLVRLTTSSSSLRQTHSIAQKHVKSSDYSHDESPYWFAETGNEHEWKKISEVVGQALAVKGTIKSSEATHMKFEEAAEKLGWSKDDYDFSVSTCHASAGRLRKLGWKPEACGIYDVIQDEVDLYLATRS